MTGIDALCFRCNECRSVDVAWLIPLNDAEAERFTAGGSLYTSLASKPPPAGCGHQKTRQ